MPKTHILEFSTYAKMGGTQQEILKFLRAASHEKYTFFVCILLEHDVLNEEVAKLQIEETSLNMRGYWDVRAWWRLSRFAREKQIALMHTYGLKAHIIGRLVGKCLGIPVNISSVHSTDPWRKWYHVLLERLTSPLTDLYISNSEAGRIATHQRERIPLAKIVTISNGIRVEEYQADEAQTERMRRRLGLRGEDRVLGIVANLRVMKGHKTIVDAFSAIQQHFPTTKCLCIGSDFLQGEIQRYVREKRLEQVILFPGFQKDIPSLLSLLEIFLLPSLWEGLPTAMMEAMAMKRPVIASAVGGIPELVEHGKTGLLIPPNDPHALAEAVVQLLRDPQRAQRMGQVGYEKIRREFSLHAMAARTEAMYDQLLKSKCLTV